MAKKLVETMVASSAKEEGFVLATSLVILLLLTMLSIGVMYSGSVSQQTSTIARDSTEAFYYAETGINYMGWALNNDAEFDSYPGTTVVKRASGTFAEPALPASPTASTVGDRYELFANMLDPGPTAISDSSAAGTSGQIMYFDNRSIFDGAGAEVRSVRWPLPTDGSGNAILPVFANISVSLPRYIKLEIDTNGNITPTIPALPHASPPVAGVDVPNNGAIVWVTAGNETEDAYIYTPTDINNVNASCEADINCPCRTGASPAPAVPYQAGQTCYVPVSGTPSWEYSFNVVAYAIGYVDGKAVRMIRAVIM